MLRSKRKKLDTGDGCLDAESGGRSGDIANTGFCVQNGKHTQMELSQEVSGDNTSQLLLEEGEDEQDELIDGYPENNDDDGIEINLQQDEGESQYDYMEPLGRDDD
jgi:hypothetical protein